MNLKKESFLIFEIGGSTLPIENWKKWPLLCSFLLLCEKKNKTCRPHVFDFSLPHLLVEILPFSSNTLSLSNFSLP